MTVWPMARQQALRPGQPLLFDPAVCPESEGCGGSARLGGEEVHRTYSDYPRKHLPPNPLPPGFRLYAGERCHGR